MISKNIKLLALSMISMDSSFSIGVFVVFMILMGLSLAEVSMVVAGFLLCSSLFQIPAGIFADRFGNKVSLLIGAILMTFGFGLFAFAENFYMFLAGYSLLGSGQAMKGGADVAFIYNDLKLLGKESDFKKIYGKIEFNLNMFWVFASISGGFLYVLNPRLPFLIEFVLSILSIFLIVSLKEKPVNNPKVKVFDHLKQSLSFALKTPKFSKIFVFSALIGSLALVTFQYLQPFYGEIGIDPKYFGVIAAITFVFRALGALKSDAVGKIFNIDRYLVLHSLVFTLFLMFFGVLKNAFVLVGIVAVFYFLRGLYNPTVSNFINQKVNDENRSTILSVNSQFLTIFSSLILLLTGYVSESFGLESVFFLIAVFSNLFLILYILSLRNVEAG